MLGLVLEGGGAKGSFHAGALKALQERGYRFDGVMGTSIGAINGAFVAQGDIDLLYKIWSEATPSQMLDIDDTQVEKLVNGEMDRGSYLYFAKVLAKALNNRGLSMDKAENFLAIHLNEEKIRQSNIDFGLVTVSVSDNFTPIEIFKESIPEGLILKYILASASFPAFKRSSIEGRSFLDGGFYDNLPINPLIRRGYDHIFAIRTMSRAPHQKVIDSSVTVEYITPSEPLGKTLTFTNGSILHNLKLGYYDAIRHLDKLVGKKYYLFPMEDEEFIAHLEKYGINMFSEWSAKVNKKGNKRSIISALSDLINKDSPSYFTQYESFISILEPVAEYLGIERFAVYSLKDFIDNMRLEYNKMNEKEAAILQIPQNEIVKILLSHEPKNRG